MTSAVATTSGSPSTETQTVPIVILGTDAMLAALPATPVQLAHACLRAGFANVIPASWGDELVASAVLRRLPEFGNGPVIQCSCPIVAHRLLSVGGDLRPAMLGFVAPPVAIARYVRALSGSTPVRITYVGGCPGANDDAIDIRMRPDALLALLADRDIVVEDQPRVFESILPPDRRRFRSQPGGVPTADSLRTEVRFTCPRRNRRRGPRGRTRSAAARGQERAHRRGAASRMRMQRRCCRGAPARRTRGRRCRDTRAAASNVAAVIDERTGVPIDPRAQCRRRRAHRSTQCLCRRCNDASHPRHG